MIKGFREWFKTLCQPVRYDQFGPEEPDFSIDDEFEAARERGSIKVNEEWDATRRLTMRGNASGAIAALALFGSQSLGNGAPRVELFSLVVLFCAGLAALFLRQLLLIWRAHQQRCGLVAAVPNGQGYLPALAFEWGARQLDKVAVLCLVAGVLWGGWTLFSLTGPA
ncbi:hypothetical protein [Roseospirillum parvum]|uniref:Uncharacterized protein n=1 Tax=Roseospirillum parvum TaxID=83401 RepID=A0A1G8EVQ3_9PROT|nr:hypothetical protein [Roseospirillum parvum]SDH73993.1 hypothetical protein SAMN05421742_11157 [Roseospirillum parvum]